MLNSEHRVHWARGLDRTPVPTLLLEDAVNHHLASAELLCVDATVMLVVHGEFDVATAHVLGEALDDASERRPAHVRVNLADSQFFGLRALEQVSAAYEQLAARGCTVDMVNPSRSVDRMIRVLDMSHLLATDPAASMPPTEALSTEATSVASG